MADVIAQVAGLPISEITIALIQQKLAVFFQEMFETFTEGTIVEWTKKVRRPAGWSPRAAGSQVLVAWYTGPGHEGPRNTAPGAWVGMGGICRGWGL